MAHLNQVQYYERREREQRLRARSAIDPDIAIFHEELADRYHKLSAEARMFLPAAMVYLA